MEDQDEIEKCLATVRNRDGEPIQKQARVGGNPMDIDNLISRTQVTPGVGTAPVM